MPLAIVQLDGVLLDQLSKLPLLGIDADAIAAAALKQAIGDEKARRWTEEHREAFAAWDRWVEENGLPLEEHRMF